MIVAVAGGKGGVGKSTTAWNLGRELDAVVVDADLAAADLPPGTGPDLHDVLAGRVDPTAAIEEIGPVTMVPCGRTLSGARASSLERFDRVLERVERERGTVVVDCPAGLARDVGVALDSADLAVLVTVPDRAALVDAVHTYDLATALETPVAAAVMNRVADEHQRAIADRFGRLLSVEATVVEQQSAVADAQARWTPVCDHVPDAQAVDAYRSVADRLERAAERRSPGPNSP